MKIDGVVCFTTRCVPVCVVFMYKITVVQVFAKTCSPFLSIEGELTTCARDPSTPSPTSGQTGGEGRDAACLALSPLLLPCPSRAVPRCLPRVPSLCVSRVLSSGP